MTLKELRSVLVGYVVLYEYNPERDPEDESTTYRDLYNGYGDDIPEGLLCRTVESAYPGVEKRIGRYTDIRLKREGNA